MTSEQKKDVANAYSNYTFDMLVNVVELSNEQKGRFFELNEQASALRERSGKAFALGKDQEAKVLRDLASELEDKATKQRREWEDMQQFRGHIALEELNARNKGTKKEPERPRSHMGMIEAPRGQQGPRNCW